MITAKILRDLRIDNDLSQKQLADLFHVDKQTILRVENSHFSPKVDLLKMYALHFNISLDYLCGLTDIPRSLDGFPYPNNIIKQVNNVHIGDISGGNNNFEIH